MKYRARIIERSTYDIKVEAENKELAVEVAMATDLHMDYRPTTVETVDISVVELAIDLPYSVDAGRYEEFMGKQSISPKYSNAFATMDEALEAFDKCQGYPWQRLSYKGRVLMGVEP